VDVRFLLFSTIFLLSGQIYLSGQRKLTTLSGQKISVRTDNSWEYDSFYLQDKNTFLEKYYSDLNHLDSHQMSLLQDIIRTAQYREINLAIQCDRLDYSIARKEVDYFEARRSKNKEMAQRLKKELQIEKGSLTTLLNEYENEKSTLEKLFSLPSCSAENQTPVILDLARTYGMEVPDTTLQNKLTDKPEEEKISNSAIVKENIAGTKKDNRNKKAKEESQRPEMTAAATTEDVRKDTRTSEFATAASNKKNRKINNLAKNPFEWDYQGPDCIMFADSENRSRYAATKHQRLLGYAPDRARQYFRDTYLLEVMAGMVKEKRATSLLFKVEIASRDAARNYGYIERGALVKLVGINGAHINLAVSSTAVMSVEPETGKVIYEFVCPLSKKDVKSLKKTPLDFMGIMWTSGFETYNIYEVDIIMQQIQCLNKYYNQ
jgi:hypothetical protein